jgi:hypothetical protein
MVTVSGTPSRLRRTPPASLREKGFSPLARSAGGVPRRGEGVFAHARFDVDGMK